MIKIGRSIDYPNNPPLIGYDRGEIFASGYCITPKVMIFLLKRIILIIEK